MGCHEGGRVGMHVDMHTQYEAVHVDMHTQYMRQFVCHVVEMTC